MTRLVERGNERLHGGIFESRELVVDERKVGVDGHLKVDCLSRVAAFNVGGEAADAVNDLLRHGVIWQCKLQVLESSV